MLNIRGVWRALTGAVLATTVLAQPATAADRELRIYNWSDYIEKSVLEDFTKETGIKITYDVFDSNDVLETKMLAGGSGYDIVVPTGPYLTRLINAKVFQKLDKSKLPNLKNMWPLITERTAIYDPGNEYSINYMWGTTSLGYNVAKIKAAMPDAPVDSWDMIFKPEVASKFKDCGVHLLDSADDILPAALHYLKLNPDSKDPEDIKKAGALLETIRPNIQKFHSSEFINALANGDICLAVGFSGDILQGATRAAEAKNGVEVVLSVPKEGAQMWFDQLAIPADAKNVAEAHLFLDYMMRPEVIAKASNYINYANGNLASQKFIDEAILKNPNIFPDEAMLKRLYVKTSYDPKLQRTVTRTWTKVTTGQ